MSQSVAYKHYLRALSRWPKDNLRPECQFQDVMQRRIDRRFLPASSSPSEASNTASPVARTPVDEKAELEQVNALYSLLEDRYSRKYALTGSLLKPASNPNHYTDLMLELERAPTRSWFERTMIKWKGFVRFQ